MAYMPVEFDLHDFKLNLNTAQSAKFHKRLKELGFDSVQNGDTLVYARGKSRITAFVHSGSALNFLPDFFDDTPGGTVYAIMEKMCVAFGGTMVGKYSIPSLGKEWDVRISGGMNLSGRADVGKRDTVIEDDPGTGHLAPSAGAQSSGRANTQQAPTQSSGSTPQPGSSQGGGQVQGGQQGESARDKLYRLYVEEAYKKHVEANGDDPAHFIKLVQNFKQQFPEETEEEKKRKTIVEALANYVGMAAGADEAKIAREIQLLIDNEEEVAMNVADQNNLDEDEVEQVMNELLGQTPSGKSAVAASMKQAVNQVQNAIQNSAGNIMSKMTTQAGVNAPGHGRNMPAGWSFDAKLAQAAVRTIGAYLYYATHSPQNIDVDAFGMHQALGTLLVALRNDADGQASTEEIYDMLEDSGIEDLDVLAQQSHTLMSQMKQVAGV